MPKFSNLNCGDAVYIVDLEKQTIEEWIIKQKRTYCYNDEISLTLSGGNEYPSRSVICIGQVSHYGNMFAKREDAEKFLKGHDVTFNELKHGDTVYCYRSDVDEVSFLTVDNIVIREDCTKYTFNGTDLSIRVGGCLFDYAANKKRDHIFDAHGGTSHKYYFCGTFFSNKKAFEEFLKKKKKYEEKKKFNEVIKKNLNYKGKPLELHDCLDKSLKIGDVVAYLKASHQSYPSVSKGVVKGESAQKISLTDSIDGSDRQVMASSVMLIEECVI